MLNAYNFFFHHYHRQLQERIRAKEEAGNQDTSAEKQELKDLAKTIAFKWKHATDEEKKFFQGLSDQDRVRHEREMSEWIKEMAQQNEALLRLPNARGNSSASRQGIQMPSQGMSPLHEREMTMAARSEMSMPTFADTSSTSMPPPLLQAQHQQYRPTVSGPLVLPPRPPHPGTTSRASLADQGTMHMSPTMPPPPPPAQYQQYNNSSASPAPFPLPAYPANTSGDALTDKARIRHLAHQLGEDGVDTVIRLFGSYR